MDGLRDFGNLTIAEAGATVTSWVPDGHRDVLFVSDAGRHPSVHGGIPLCAPWFGKGRDEVTVPRSHGLIKWVPWRLSSHEQDGGDQVSVWSLDSGDVAHLPGASDYPDDLSYSYTVRSGSELTVSLTITSPTTETIIDQAFHTYFSVSDLASITIDGLDGTRSRDYVRGGLESVHTGELRLEGYHDTIYFGATGPITLADTDRVITIEPMGTRDAIVWNPGADNAERTAGMNPEDWRQFICIELGNVQRHSVTVPAGGSVTMGMRISVSHA